MAALSNLEDSRPTNLRHGASAAQLGASAGFGCVVGSRYSVLSFWLVAATVDTSPVGRRLALLS
jgi:hypothetical protein